MAIQIKKGILIALGSEVFLKSTGVQRDFVRKLRNNLLFYLKKQNLKFKIYLSHERIFIETEPIRLILKLIRNLFGVAWFSESYFLERASLKELVKFITKNYQTWIKKDETFALRLKKSSEIKESSQKIIETVAQKINRKVDLEKPKKEIYLEARKVGWFLYFKKQRGADGLPVGASGRVLTLISGGIDSPVASYLMAKRGAENIWLHFHSFPLVSSASIEKTKELAQRFLNYQPKLKIYFYPFGQIQMAIKTKIPPSYRILFYRRLMLKIAEQIAQQEKCLALVTGESLGQVSSQTLTNLGITNAVVKLPILRPLIGLDKQEIIQLAQKIKTFEISIRPQEDCCTLFTPKHVTAQGNLEMVEKMEKNLNLNRLIKKSFKEKSIFYL
ncbi:MAG: tRNA uracil 4-sulfurtransferase ThiI [Minisyncoccales bacterium]